MNFNCPKCWNTPCTCGWSYRFIRLEDLKKLEQAVHRAVEYRTENPTAKFSSSGEKETKDDALFMRKIKTGF